MVGVKGRRREGIEQIDVKDFLSELRQQVAIEAGCYFGYLMYTFFYVLVGKISADGQFGHR